MRKVMIVLGLGLIFCGALAGCKKKSEEKEIGELLGKMNEAKTESEARKIEKKIEELTEKLEKEEKKKIKEVEAKLGKPFTFWQLGGLAMNEKITQFSMTFELISVHKQHPFAPEVARTPEGKKHIKVTTKIRNLGPREGTPSATMELKVDKGYIYDVGPFGEMYPGPRYETDVFGKKMYSLEPGQTGWKFFHSEIPENTNPIEIFGTLGGATFPRIPGKTKFRLKLPSRHLSSKEDIYRGERAKSPKDSKKEMSLSKDTIPGRYIIELVKKDGTIEKPPGITIFKKDGTIILKSGDSEFASGLTWRLKHGTVQLYQSEGKSLEGRIEGDAIVFEENGVGLRYIKQNGHPPPISSTKLREVENLSSPSGIGLEQETKPKSVYDLWEEDEKRLRTELATELKFKKLSMEDEIQAQRLWEVVITQRKMARLPIMGYKQMVYSCREIIRRWPESEYAFKAKRALADLPERYRKMYNITKEETDLSQTLGHSNLSQQINRRRELFADSSVFPKPHVSLTLRAMAPDLVEKVETLYLAALDYQFLSLKSLRYARASLDDSDLAMAKNYTEKADRYYRVAVALQRDSQAVLDGTYSAAETATKGVKDACQTATTLGLKVINPVAGKVVDYVYVGVDYAVERATIGADEAGKNALKRLIVKALFKEVEFSALGNRTIADYIGSRIGKDVFPLLDKLLRSEEAKFAILNIIKESGVKVSEEVLLREILGVGK